MAVAKASVPPLSGRQVSWSLGTDAMNGSITTSSYGPSITYSPGSVVGTYTLSALLTPPAGPATLDSQTLRTITNTILRDPRQSLPRIGHTSVVLKSGRILLIGGSDENNVALAKTELFDPQTQHFYPASSLREARYGHISIMLTDGRVLAAGGYDGSHFLNTAELYDPATNTWSSAPPMATEHYMGIVAALVNGDVLVAGGQSATAPATTTAEIYHLATNSWSATGNMIQARIGHAMSTLPSGSVLVVGGEGPGMPDSAKGTEIYDPRTGTWQSASAMATPRYAGHAASRLPDGKILVTGGFNTNQSSIAGSEVFDPVAKSWHNVPPMANARIWHSSTALMDGKILVAGGYGWEGSEVFDPSSESWTTVGPLSYKRHSHTCDLLPDGRPIVIAGTSVNAGGVGAPMSTYEVFSPDYGIWSNPSSVPTIPRRVFGLTHLPDGRVVMFGGSQPTTSAPLYDTWIFDPTSGNWTQTGRMRNGRFNHAWGTGADGKIFTVGGYAFDATMLNGPEAEWFDPATSSWSPMSPPRVNRQTGHSVTVLKDGRVLVVGSVGYSAPGAEIYDPTTDTWKDAGTQQDVDFRLYHQAVVLPDGRVLVAGGYNAFYLTTPLKACIYDPVANTWATAGTPGHEHISGIMALLPNGKVLLAGGSNDLSKIKGATESDLYNPATNTWSVSGPLNTPRTFPHFAVLSDGRVFLHGGYDPNKDHFLESTEIYDPGTGQWSPGPSLPLMNRSPQITNLPGGRVLLIGAGPAFYDSILYFHP
ncbi:MAG TPA: kelch repeat-containing protein [Geothrix sp.]|nr:kelch repeat-containing protein [Geothrix sp.]